MKAWITLADFAQVHAGKLNVIGGGVYLIGPQPSSLGIAVELLLPWEFRSRRMTFRLDLVDADGRPAQLPTAVGETPLEITAEYEVIAAPGTPPGSELPFAFAFNAVGLTLAPTSYTWRLFLDNAEQPSATASFSFRRPDGERT